MDDKILNPYVFMLFKQSGHVTVSSALKSQLHQNISFSELINQWQLTGTCKPLYFLYYVVIFLRVILILCVLISNSLEYNCENILLKLFLLIFVYVVIGIYNK